jgi:hypothetical protein
MRSIKLAIMLVALSVAASAQQTASAPEKTPPIPATPANAGDRQKLHESAMKFVEASETRRRLEQSLNVLLEDGKQSMLKKNPLMNPLFGDEWVKRMRLRINLDDFVDVTAYAYEKFFTSDEIDELTHRQLALKRGQIYSLPPLLAEKLKSNSPLIQKEINLQTSLIGARLGKEVGEEIAKDHPEWVKPATASAPPEQK